MEKIGVIIPDRGDRAELTQFCFKQLSVMTIQLDKIFHINYAPTSGNCDIIPRIQEGIKQAKEAGIDWCFIIENDDAYPSDYFERYTPYMDKFDFIGDQCTYYYNIFSKRWQFFNHTNRSSLFTTAFRVDSLVYDFEWPESHKRFVDIPLWEYAMRKGKVKFINSGAVGIKHGIGKCGGLGHFMNLDNDDSSFEFLKSKLTPLHIEFYDKLICKASNLV